MARLTCIALTYLSPIVSGLCGLSEECIIIILRLQARLSKSDEIAQLGSVVLILVPIIGQHNRRLDGVTSSRSVLI